MISDKGDIRVMGVDGMSNADIFDEYFDDNKPLRLKGDLRKLTHNAKKWFAYWNANDNIRNISLLEEKK